MILLDDDEWVPSGDLGQLNSDGSWSLKGRHSELFKRHGEKISLLRITEDLLEALDGIRFVLYREIDAEAEEGYCMVLELSALGGEFKAALRMFRSKYPRSSWPIRIESVVSLPLLPSGKPDLAAVKQMDGKPVLWNQPHL